MGSAMLQSFQDHNIQTYAYDPDKGHIDWEPILHTNMVFLSLPTLYDPETQSYNKDAIHQTCQRLQGYQGLVILKSTVEIGTTQELAETYQLNMVHNPEFLTASSAYEDFRDQEHIVIGGNSAKLVDFYSTYYPDAEISICTSQESEAMKLFVNNFYSIKIMAFNEFFLTCQSLNLPYDSVLHLMLKNGYINPMHTMVPDIDGNLGYGGACFPKDTNALLQQMKRLNIPCQLLEACVKERNELRDD